MNNNCGIYKIVNLVTGDFYIGSANNIRKRLNHHKHCLANSKHCNLHLQNAWNKYGAEKFEFSPALLCGIENKLYYEQVLLDGLKPPYNIAINALAPGQGLRHTDEAKRKIGNANKGERNYLFGKHPSEETRKKLSEAGKGRHPSEETKRKLREAKIGHVVTEEAKRKISEAKIGHITTDEHRHKLSESGKRYWANNGKTRGVSDETKRKISEAKKGKTGARHSEETKRKISESNKRCWEEERRNKRSTNG